MNFGTLVRTERERQFTLRALWKLTAEPVGGIKGPSVVVASAAFACKQMCCSVYTKHS